MLRASIGILRADPCLLTRPFTPVHVQKLNVKSDFTYAHRTAEVNEPQHKQGQKQESVAKTNQNEHCMIKKQSKIKENLRKPDRSLRKPLENKRTPWKIKGQLRKTKGSLRKT